MRLARLFNIAGIVLLASSFGWASWHVASYQRQEEGNGVVTIRFGHWQLESGLRTAFDALAKEYMKTHPHVNVVQVAVPGPVYMTWLQTGYAGKTMPDLVVLGGATAEVLNSSYIPLTSELAKPNPYNKGTPLENVPWRETFLDGLSHSAGIETLQEYYSVPIAVMTQRMYYNRRLWRDIFGNEETPKNYQEFLDDCRKVREYSARTGRGILPIAGSRFGGNILFTELFESQTQKLALKLDHLHSLQFLNDPTAVSFLPGLATLDDPEVRKGLEIMRELGNEMQPGFLQLDRNDAILYFGQGRALMIPTGVWDYVSIAEQSPFEIGVFPTPYPDKSNPEFGEGVLGHPAEGEAGGGFCLSAYSKHPDIAVDFLKFMSSVPGSQLFVNISKWPSSLLDVKPAPETEVFKPIPEGYTGGFCIAPIMWGTGEVYRLHYQNFQRMLGPTGSVENYLAAVKPYFQAAVRQDVLKLTQDQTLSVEQVDGMAASLGVLARVYHEQNTAKLSAVFEVQNSVESLSAWMRSEANAIKPGGTPH